MGVFPALYSAFTETADRGVSEGGQASVFRIKMVHLQPIPRRSEMEPATRPVTIVSAESRDVVYIDDAASLEIIQAALKAWGLKVREERDERMPTTAHTQQSPRDLSATWETERPGHAPPSRLENRLSPLWLPIRRPLGNEAVAAWSWFTTAA